MRPVAEVSICSKIPTAPRRPIDVVTHQCRQLSAAAIAHAKLQLRAADFNAEKHMSHSGRGNEQSPESSESCGATAAMKRRMQNAESNADCRSRSHLHSEFCILNFNVCGSSFDPYENGLASSRTSSRRIIIVCSAWRNLRANSGRIIAAADQRMASSVAFRPAGGQRLRKLLNELATAGLPDRQCRGRRPMTPRWLLSFVH